jgi:hypothetical protein
VDSNPWFTRASCSFIPSLEQEENTRSRSWEAHDRAGAIETRQKAHSAPLISTAR